MTVDEWIDESINGPRAIHRNDVVDEMADAIREAFGAEVITRSLSKQTARLLAIAALSVAERRLGSLQTDAEKDK